jgi:hypothetical protein
VGAKRIIAMGKAKQKWMVDERKPQTTLSAMEPKYAKTMVVRETAL